MYLDVLKKLEFYKDFIIKEFIKNGVYPDDKTIKSRLDSIDAYLCIYSHVNAAKSSKVEVEKMQEGLNDVYNDIKILYEVLNELLEDRLMRLSAFANCHTEELENLTSMLEKRSHMEIESTTIGKTIFAQYDKFDMTRNNGIVTADLGSLKFTAGSTIACIADINNIEAENIVFYFTDEYGQVHSCAPYNYNQDSLTIAGEPSCNEYDIEFKDNQNLSGEIKLDIGKVPDSLNSYNVYSGYNKIAVKNSSGVISYEVIPANNNFGVLDRSMVDFYTIGASNLSMKLTKAPINANFSYSENDIAITKNVKEFTMNLNADTGFTMKIDKGKIYAIKQTGFVKDNGICVNVLDDSHVYHVCEYLSGQEKTYNVKVEIATEDKFLPDISSIVLKEISEV